MYPVTDKVLHWMELVLFDRFGQNWCLRRVGSSLHLGLKGAENSIIFDNLIGRFAEASSNQEFTWWEAEKEGWVSLFGARMAAPGASQLPNPLIEKIGNQYFVHYDIPGLIYWMLARVEEIGRNETDAHSRFPAYASHAFKNNYLQKPVVDEWLAVLSQVICRQWPQIQLINKTPRTLVTCDVDNPYQVDFRSYATIRGFAVDVIKQRNLSLAFKNLYHRVLLGLGESSHDYFFQNIHWILDVNEEAGNTVIFYFMAGGNHPYDGCYDLNRRTIRQLLRSIHNRGHIIGLHPSYRSFLDVDLMKQEANRLRRVLEHEGISQELLYSRQHYLRWRTGETARNIESCHLKFDSSLTYAETLGFRCGTSHEFQMFDAERGRIMNIWQQPLMLMETTLIGTHYMDVSDYDEMVVAIEKMKKITLLSGGQFNLLWHNCSLSAGENRKAYLRAITNIGV